MEILLEQHDSTKYYDEVLAILSNYKKLVKNPRKKIRGLTSSAISLTLIAVVFIIIMQEYHNFCKLWMNCKLGILLFY